MRIVARDAPEKHIVRSEPVSNLAVQQLERVRGAAIATLEDATAASVNTAMLPAVRIDVRIVSPFGAPEPSLASDKGRVSRAG